MSRRDFGPALMVQVMMGQVKSWQRTRGTLVHAAGLKSGSFGDFANLAGGTTWIMPNLACRQDGQVTQAKFRIGSVVWTNVTLKLKFFRWNGSAYAMTDERSYTVTGAAKEVVSVLVDPPIEVKIGDVPGHYSTGSGTPTVRSSSAAGYTLLSTAGDITTSDAFVTASASRAADIEFLMTAPYLAYTGDSIPEGHGAAAGSANHGGLHPGAYTGSVVTVPWFKPAMDLGAILGTAMRGLRYQNLSLGSQTMAWVASTGIVECLAVNPMVVIVHAGINDVAGARTWEAYAADLDSVLAAVRAASPAPKLIVSEILPWTAGSDLQAETIRTWNASLAAWCANNAVKLALTHDVMGQVRPSTGMIDDLKTAYNYDGVHPNAAGMAALAAALQAAITQ